MPAAPCQPGCQCKKHVAPKRLEHRAKVAQNMRSVWQDRHDDPELMALVSQSMSDAHVQRWTPERRAAVKAGHLHTDEARQKASAARRGSARGYSLNPAGYRDLHMQDDHPLARSGGLLGEHRKVLYDAIGAGPHPCHWCGKSLEWGGLGGIVADHVDNDKLNNDPSNLVPSCNPCNTGRG